MAGWLAGQTNMTFYIMVQVFATQDSRLDEPEWFHRSICYLYGSKIGNLVAALPGTCCYRVSTRTGWPGLCMLWLGEKACFIWSLSVAAHTTKRIHPWETLCMLLWSLNSSNSMSVHYHLCSYLRDYTTSQSTRQSRWCGNQKSGHSVMLPLSISVSILICAVIGVVFPTITSYKITAGRVMLTVALMLPLSVHLISLFIVVMNVVFITVTNSKG